MKASLSLAARGVGRVSPNPMVGAVLVANTGDVLSTGYHRRFGGAHAEVECLRRFKGDVAGSTLYVNLEPCSHHGKTPPCADLIVRSGLRRVVVAMLDPNPAVAGRGVARLRRAGISVSVGVCASEARVLNRHFIRHITTRRPFVHVKVAQTVDGKIGSGGKRQKWITGPLSRKLVHGWRSRCDAVLVGAGTITADDPRLDVRLVRGRNPDVVILDGSLRVPASARVFSDTSSRRVFVCTAEARDARSRRVVQELSLAGAIILSFHAPGGRIPLRRILSELYRHQIGSVLVEGGGEVFSEFLAEGLVDELSLFVAPRVLPRGMPAFSAQGSAASSRRVESLDARRIGGDVLVTALFR